VCAIVGDETQDDAGRVPSAPHQQFHQLIDLARWQQKLATSAAIRLDGTPKALHKFATQPGRSARTRIGWRRANFQYPCKGLFENRDFGFDWRDATSALSEATGAGRVALYRHLALVLFTRWFAGSQLGLITPHGSAGRIDVGPEPKLRASRRKRLNP
jgi:hypothetical protein